ncbi:hypothetical protein [Paenisporosarcina sp. TG20]|uniref:hypothetical protein n=1 Tax=Paenisporosarcina sp. TG20 TaxID=1211706 RepID=UPI00030D6E96|nr:hypothetical protein [Paenisporosarcina sp. TG20]
MGPENMDEKEMKLRRDRDFIASLDMVGEGAPIYYLDKDEETAEEVSDKSN